MSSLTSPGLVRAGDKAIIAARKYLEKLSLFSTDFSADAVAPGTTLKIPVFSGTATDFNPSASPTPAGYNNSEGSIKWAAITFNAHKKLTFGLTDSDKLLVDTDPFWANCGKAAGQAVGQALLTVATSKLVYTAATQYTSWSCTLANMAKIREKCAAASIDPARCVVILEPATYATLLALLPSNVIGDGSAVVSGVIDGLFGFKAVIEGNTISKQSGESSGTAVNKGVGFVVPEDALAVAARIVRPQDGVCEEFGTTTDEITGLTLGHRVTVDQNSGTRNYTVEAVLGAALTLQSSNGAPTILQLVTA